ncbi:MAG: DMT family transporter [Actinomycetota bacterium]
MSSSPLAAVRRAATARTGTGFLFVVLASALWGTDALFRRGLALELPASSVVFAEHAILVVLTLPLLRRALPALRAFTRADWVSIVLIGSGASATATMLFTAAFAFDDPNAPLLLQKLQPLVAVLGARLILGERLMPRYLLYFALAVGGAYLITFPDPLAASVTRLAPALLAAGAASLWALGTVLGRRLTARVAVGPLTALRIAFGLPASALIVMLVQGPSGFAVYAPADGTALLLLALVPGLLALLLYYRGLARTPAAAATLGELAFPLSALVINHLAFGATVTATQAIGIALLAGTITVMGLAGRRDAESVGVGDPRAGGPDPVVGAGVPVVTSGAGRPPR